MSSTIHHLSQERLTSLLQAREQQLRSVLDVGDTLRSATAAGADVTDFNRRVVVYPPPAVADGGRVTVRTP